MNSTRWLGAAQSAIAGLQWRLQALIDGPNAGPGKSAPPGMTSARPPRRALVALARADEPAIGFKLCSAAPVDRALATRIVARFVTPTPETQRQISRARPQFEGHAQPRLPSIFNLCLTPATLRQQAELAWQYGIDAFAFDLDADDQRPQPALMYCQLGDLALSYCAVLKSADLRLHANGLVARLQPLLADPRYLRADDRPVLLVEDIAGDSVAASELALWRDLAQRHGLGALFMVVRRPAGGDDPIACGFDATLTPPPDIKTLPSIEHRQTPVNPDFAGDVHDWRALAPAPEASAATLAMVLSGADDEPLHPQCGRVGAHASPRAYGDWLCRSLVQMASAGTPTRSLVVVDSWNDWPRGAVLEPDTRLGHAYLDATRRARAAASRLLSGASGVRQPRPCAVVHVYYLELVDEIATALLAAGNDWRVVVTTQACHAEEVAARLAARGITAEVEVHENRGRDILPFLRVANRLLDEGVEVVLKLHTKQSLHMADGAAWRAELVGRLVGPDRARQIVEAFESDPTLGCVAPEGHVLRLAEFWGANEDTVRHLCVRMGAPDPEPAHDEFVAGSMCWVRLSALRPLLDAHLGEWEFAAEQGHIDGTMAHAVERTLALAVKHAGFKTTTAADLCGAAFLGGAEYAFALSGERGVGGAGS